LTLKGLKVSNKSPFPEIRNPYSHFLEKSTLSEDLSQILSKIMKPINKFLKKDVDFKWDENGKLSFESIKEAIVKSPVLVSLDYSKDFQVFSFSSEGYHCGCFLQKNDQGEEKPIDFMSKVLRDVELKYSIMEKKAYTLVKSLKHFKTYVGYSKIIAYVPHSAVKDILAQQDCLGTRGKWVSKIQEYDLEIKPTKLIKGQGLAQMMEEGNEVSLGMKEDPFHMISMVLEELECHDWYVILFIILRILQVQIT
jgi:hypothetical protein